MWLFVEFVRISKKFQRFPSWSSGFGRLSFRAMTSNIKVDDSKKRALEAVQRRFDSETRAQHPQTGDKRIRRHKSPDPEIDCPTFSRITQPVHEKLATTVVEVSNKENSVVDKLLHELFRKGDSAHKFIHGSKSIKVDYHINLDNCYKKNSTTGASLRALHANSKRSKKHMSMKQLKKIGLLDLPEDSYKYELFLDMHEMWKDYVLQLLRNVGKNQVAAVLFTANLHGAILQVIDCKIYSFIGVLGIMIRETAQTFGIVTQDNKFRVIPKKDSVFALRANCWKITLLGDKFMSRKSSS